MPVKKIGKKFFPLKKNGEPWKNGFPTQAKAQAAITSNNARLKKLAGKKPKKKGGGNVADNPSENNKSKNKFPPGKMLDLYLLSAEGTEEALLAATGAIDPKVAMGRAVGGYTGFDPNSGTFKIARLNRGYGPIVISKGFRRLMKMGGVPSLPTTKPKTVGDFLDNISFYGATGVEIFTNARTDPELAHRIAVRNLGGVDFQDGLTSKIAVGNAALKSYGPYFIQRRIRRFLREVFGIKFSM